MKAKIIHQSQVNITEKDIEDWLWENPDSIRLDGVPIDRWAARQYRVPSGIIDLLGILEFEQMGEIITQAVVVEVKNTEITAEALTQVFRYAADIGHIMADPSFTYCAVEKVVIGKSPITNEIQFEADALEIRLLTFDIELNVRVGGPWNWKEDYRQKLVEQYTALSSDPVFENFKKLEESKNIIEEAHRILKDGEE